MKPKFKLDMMGWADSLEEDYRADKYGISQGRPVTKLVLVEAGTGMKVALEFLGRLETEFYWDVQKSFRERANPHHFVLEFGGEKEEPKFTMNQIENVSKTKPNLRIVKEEEEEETR